MRDAHDGQAGAMRSPAGDTEAILEDAAAAVADVSDVDWGARLAAAPALASRLSSLKAIASLARAFRAAGAARPGAPEPAAGPRDPGLRRWSHLRLLERLGEGSFGEVFRAHDPVLDRFVALKLSKAPVGGGAERRYLEEARRLARVRHPNVVVVHGVEVHEGRVGIWTDLVEGETLEELLARSGPLAAREAAAIGADVCRALAAVHAQALVHGDVKASNVMRDRDGRVVLMDFGTVKEAAPGSGNAIVTRGTPLVLAPELLRGEPPTPAADLYSAGVLLYQLLTGRYPVEGATVGEVVRRHAAGAVTPLRERRAEVPAELARVVEQALDGDPRRRPAHAGEMRQRLEAIAAAGAGRRSPRTAVAAALLGIALAVSGALAAARHGGAAPPPRTSVAVLGFKDLSRRAETAWLSAALSEMLATELGAGQALRVVPAEQVERAKVEMGLAPGEAGGEALRRLRRSVGAEFVAVGSYLALGGPADPIRLDVRLHDTAAGETVATVTEAGTERELFDLVARTGSRLRARLGAAAGPATTHARAALPRGRDAAKLYMEGLARMRVFDTAGARDLLERAVAADPEFAPAHSALASAFAALGHDLRARQAAGRAFQLASGLDAAERMAVEARFREATREWPRAIEIYRTLRALHPDDLEAGLRQASAQTASGQARDARATVAELRRLPAPASQDARIDLEEAAAAYALSDYRRAQAAAARAAEKGTALGARLLVARARLQEGASWSSLGENQPALAAAEEARRLFGETRDALGSARTLYLMSAVLWNEGDLARAQQAAEEALAIFRGLGAGSGTALALDRLGELLRDRGQFDAAEARFEEALPLERELGNPRGEASVLHGLGVVRYARGELRRARAAFEEALAINRRIGHKAAEAYQLNSIANILLETGQAAAALETYGQAVALAREVGLRTGVALYLNNIGEARLLLGEPALAGAAHEEALAVSRAIGSPSRIARSLRGLGNALAEQADLTGSRVLLEEAVALLEPTGEGTGLASSRQALAEVAIEQGRPAEAIGLLRAADEEWRRQKRPSGEAGTQALLAQAAWAAGDGGTAKAALARALALLPTIDSRDTRARLTASLQPLRVEMAPRPAPCTAEPARGALRALESAARDSRAMGYAQLDLQARLGLAAVEIGCGRAASGRDRAAAVEKDARSRGLGLLAAKAARLRAS